VIDIPGHTLGHIAYLWEGGMFCGDTLFTCGCGKIFEGTPAQLHHSLQRLASMPDDTLVYCTHEYTEYNTPFAQICEPGNTALKQRVVDAETLRSQNIPTVPSILRLEKDTNPFLRCKEPEIIQHIEQHFGVKLPAGDELAAFTALRKWRDQF
jgi:hydroxyacylglutathione hydrolase